MLKKNYIIVKDRHPRISEVLNDCISLCVPASKDEPLSCILQKICAKLTSTISDVATLEAEVEALQAASPSTGTSRFGVSGEDDTATENREFELGLTNFLEIRSTPQAWTYFDVNSENIDLYTETEGGGGNDSVEITLNPGNIYMFLDTNSEWQLDGITQDNSSTKLLAIDGSDHVKWVSKASIGGGASARFGVTGEDDTAGENRSFLLGTNTFSVGTGLSINGSTGAVGIGSTIKLTVDNTSNIVTIKNGADTHFKTDINNGLYYLGNTDGTGNNSFLFIDRSTKEMSFYNGASRYLSLTNGSNFAIGDIDDSANGTRLNMIDGSGFISLQTLLGSTLTKLELNATSQTITGQIGGFTFFSLNRASRLYQLGDIQNIGNNCYLEIDDSNGVMKFNTSSGERLRVDIGSGIHSFGNTSISYLQINEASSQVRVSGTNGLQINGDTTLVHSGTNLSNGAGVSLGTLTNAPSVGNPTKWIAIDDNGTTRHIPAW